VNEPQLNVGHFHHRPTYKVAGLLYLTVVETFG